MIKYFAVVTAASAILVGCTQAPPATDTTPQTDAMPIENATAPETIVGQDDSMVTTPVSISMVMQDFAYAPNSLNVRPGDTVTVALDNPDSMPHDFVIDELGVNSGIINPGEAGEVSFTIPADASGMSYYFYCSVGTHRDQGMEGMVIVE